MRDTHKWEELLPEEFYEEFERRPVVYWACGPMEEHGLHNVLGTDPCKAYEICRRAVEITGGILFPMVPLASEWRRPWSGYSRTQLRSSKDELRPPSLWTSNELCDLVYVELMESMADLGFKVCVAFGGHWPADALLQEIEKRYEGRIENMKFWGGGTVRILEDVLEEERGKDPNLGGHGAMWETSMIAAVRPDFVDVARAARIMDSPLPSILKAHASPEEIAHIADANPEFGERLLNIAAERIAKAAMEMLES